MHITTLPVYSRLADEQHLPVEVKACIPAGRCLSEHQVATYRALNSDAEVIFNVAITGDGKSLAGQLPTLIQSRPTMAMYPTNELIRDQLRQSQAALNLWKRDDLLLTHVDARKLDALEDEEELRRPEALLNLWRNHEFVLTNPDIFHYVMQQYYVHTGKQGGPPDRVIGPLLDLFAQFTFDEFHVFQTPQVVAILNALLFIRQATGQQRSPKFLFLSATPGELLLQALERAKLRSVQIHGHYLHTWQEPEAAQWRRILHGGTLAFAPQRVEEWVEAHLDDTV